MTERVEPIYADNPGSIPADYVVPPGSGVALESVVVRWNGAAAAARFLPCLSLFTQDNRRVGTFHPNRSLAVGDTGVVTYAPF